MEVRLKITVNSIKELRGQSGAGVIDCRNTLVETEGDIEKALQLLKERSLFKAQKKVNRVATQGLVECYIHTGGRIGAMVELNCETDFVARTDEFKELAHHLSMQIAALSPEFISEEDVPEGSEAEPQVSCLLLQPDIRDPSKTIRDVISETIAKVGENIKVSRIARFEIGH